MKEFIFCSTGNINLRRDIGSDHIKKINIDKIDIGGVPFGKWIPSLIKPGAVCEFFASIIDDRVNKFFRLQGKRRVEEEYREHEHYSKVSQTKRK